LTSRCRILLVVVLPLAISWLLAASVPVITSLPGWHPQGGAPEVPFLLTPGAAGGHVRSSVYYFVVILAAATVSIAPIEISKFAVSRHSSLLYIALVVQQLVTAADVVRANAWDWWMFLLSVAHVHEVDSWSWTESHPSLIGLWPWPSLVSGTTLSAVIYIAFRKAQVGAMSTLRT
jgi:hypothetical protein